MSNKIAIVAYSWGLRKNSVSPSNLDIASAVLSLKEYCEERGYEVFIFSQWEITSILIESGAKIEVSSEDNKFDLNGRKRFLDTGLVWDDFVPRLKEIGIDQVVLVCQPFLHYSKALMLAKHDGFTVLKIANFKVSFDPFSEYWQCRNRFNALLYAIHQVIFGRTK